MMARGLTRYLRVLSLLAAMAAGCSEPTTKPGVQIDVTSTQALVDGLMAARAPRTGGQDRAARLLAGAYGTIGVPAALQQVPYLSIQPTATSFVATGRGWTQSPAAGTGYITWSRRPQAQVSVAGAPIVFAGYGIVSNEFQWDDYKTADVRDKVVLVLDADPRNGDRDEFGPLGEAYYGRSSYKFAEAAKHGAAAVIIIYDDANGAQGWGQIANWIGDGVLTFADLTTDASGVPVIEGWMTSAAAQSMLQAAGLDLAKLRDLARERTFEPTEVNATATMAVTSTLTRGSATNVVATIKGQTPEYVLVSSALNQPVPLGGDQPTAAPLLVSLADAFKRRPPPYRTIVFLSTATTADEGLVGLSYWLRHPTIPLSQTRAGIFVAGANLFAPPAPMRVIGEAYEGLSHMVTDSAQQMQRVVEADYTPAAARYYRDTQEAFAAATIPYMYVSSAPKAPAPAAHTINETGAESDLGVMFATISKAVDATNWPATPPPEALPGRN